MSVRIRQFVERTIIQRLVMDIISEGHNVTVNNGEEYVLKNSKSVAKVMKAIMTTDEDHLYVDWDGEIGCKWWIWLVYGNEGPTVINDHSTSLEHLVKGADKVAEYWEQEGPWEMGEELREVIRQML